MSNITINNINNNPNENLRELELKNYQNWSAFYAEEAAKLQTFLTQFGFDKNDFLASATCCDKFNAIINVAQKLKLDEFDQTTALNQSVASLIDANFEQSKQRIALERERNELDERLRKVHTFHETLVNDYALVKASLPSETSHLNEMETNIQYMQVKLDKYKNQINENALKLSLVDRKLLHENIFDEFKSLEAVQASIDAAKTQLNEYQNLPPDFNDAKLKLDTMRAQIKRLDEEIENKFGVLD